MQHNLERLSFIFFFFTWQDDSLNDKQISQAKTASKAPTEPLLSKGEEVLTVPEKGSAESQRLT